MPIWWSQPPTGGHRSLIHGAWNRGYERFWVICDVTFMVRNAFPIKNWFAFEAVVNELASLYPQLLMCLYNLDRFSGEMVMNVLQTHPRVFVNGIIIPNTPYVPPRQFPGILGA